MTAPYRTESFKAKLFNQLVAKIEEHEKRMMILAEYGVELKPDETTKLLVKLVEIINTPEPESSRSGDWRD